MAELIYYPILILLLIIQMVIVRHLPLFQGTADLLLLFLISWALHKQGKHSWIGAGFSAALLAFVSAAPWYSYAFSYFFAVGLSRFMSKRFWHSPLIALILVTFLSAVVQMAAIYLTLSISGINLDPGLSLRQVMIPSVFLNLVLALPMYAFVHDMSRWVYPLEVEE